ncbi:MAG: hypothetical protein ACIWVG_16350 [Gloeotrichia echinulata HAB0833]
MTASSDKVQFIEYHQPHLKSGDYTLTVTQEIESKIEPIIKESFKTELNFSILGPRFALDPQQIQSVFPPEGSLGDHSNVLPHIILKRSTLPWERQLVQAQKDQNNDSQSWLALLLFAEGEFPQETSTTLGELKKGSTGKIKWPQISPETGEQESDGVSVIDIPWSILQNIIPTAEDLKYLTHVRTTKNADGTQGEEELAVIISNRLPAPGKMSTVHLVSLEGRYKKDGEKVVFNEQGAEDQDLIRLVSLKSWRFACLDHKQSFKGLLMHLNHQLLFNIKNVGAENNKPSDFLTKGEVTESLKTAFQQSKHSLSQDISVEYRKWKITDKNRIYLISNLISNKYYVYNQAGKFLFELENSPASFQIPHEITPETLKSFETNKHRLSEQSKIVESPSDCWWIKTQYFISGQKDNNNKTQYFISGQKDNNNKIYILYVYYLDPDSSSTLRLPPLKTTDSSLNTVATVAEQYMKMGCVPLPHAMRQGNKTVSWYHGPLIPGSNKTTNNFSLPIRSADELVSYNSEYGMFDVSYAAAWELGRLLALQSKSFSVSLYNWKRTHAQKLKDTKHKLEDKLDHLPFASPSPPSDIPQTVSDWFQKLALLEGVPFNYLVPDERLLPPESIRFFQIDQMWMECLLDGAFSIGRVSTTHTEIDNKSSERIKDFLSQKISGFLMRSDVVSGWPNLLVDGYYYDEDKTMKQLTLLRQATLSKNVLICLFDGVIETLDLHLKPESLHFGLDFPQENKDGLYKKLRGSNGDEINQRIDPIPSRDNVTAKVIKIAELAGEIAELVPEIGESTKESGKALSSAEFALQMIEGVERVRFEKIT